MSDEDDLLRPELWWSGGGDPGRHRVGSGGFVAEGPHAGSSLFRNPTNLAEQQHPFPEGGAKVCIVLPPGTVLNIATWQEGDPLHLDNGWIVTGPTSTAILRNPDDLHCEAQPSGEEHVCIVLPPARVSYRRVWPRPE